jgi:hypothetical protein
MGLEAKDPAMPKSAQGGRPIVLAILSKTCGGETFGEVYTPYGGQPWPETGAIGQPGEVPAVSYAQKLVTA